MIGPAGPDVAPPPAAPGMAVGLFGGSFDPPHAGHRHASLLAMRAAGLDRVWWLVSPGNPLKDTHGLPSVGARVAAARAVARHPRIAVTGIEAELGLRYTADVVAALVAMRPRVHFVFVIGADNWAQFHRWRRWRDIALTVPIVVVDRPGATLAALAGPAARAFRSARVLPEDARRIAFMRPPAWVLVTGPRNALSSTTLRAARPR